MARCNDWCQKKKKGAPSVNKLFFSFTEIFLWHPAFIYRCIPLMHSDVLEIKMENSVVEVKNPVIFSMCSINEKNSMLLKGKGLLKGTRVGMTLQFRLGM